MLRLSQAERQMARVCELEAKLEAWVSAPCQPCQAHESLRPMAAEVRGLLERTCRVLGAGEGPSELGSLEAGP